MRNDPLHRDIDFLWGLIALGVLTCAAVISGAVATVGVLVRLGL